MASERTERGPAKAKKSTASSKAKGSASRAPARATRETEEPVLSGRLVWVVALFAAMVFIPLSPLSSLIEKKGPTATKHEHWKVGSEGTLHITVITADYNKLACAHPETAGPNHCAFESEKQAWPRDPTASLDDNKRNIVQPYRTVDGQLVFIAGLWAQPAVAMRLHNEPPYGTPENKLARFTAQCRVRFLAEWKQPSLRWGPSQPWSRQGDAMVAEPVSCEILTTERPKDS